MTEEVVPGPSAQLTAYVTGASAGLYAAALTAGYDDTVVFAYYPARQRADEETAAILWVNQMMRALLTVVPDEGLDQMNTRVPQQLILAVEAAVKQLLALLGAFGRRAQGYNPREALIVFRLARYFGKRLTPRGVNEAAIILNAEVQSMNYLRESVGEEIIRMAVPSLIEIGAAVDRLVGFFTPENFPWVSAFDGTTTGSANQDGGPQPLERLLWEIVYATFSWELIYTLHHFGGRQRERADWLVTTAVLLQNESARFAELLIREVRGDYGTRTLRARYSGYPVQQMGPNLRHDLSYDPSWLASAQF